MRRFLLAPLLFAAACSSKSEPVATPSDAGDDTLVDDTPAEDSGRPPVATPPDPPVTCPVAVPADTLADKRAACTFGTGATVESTLGVPGSVGKSLPIRHVVILMKENRSFDHILGKLHDVQPEVEAVPDTFQNVDATGAAVKPFHATTTCIHNDPNHQWDAMHNAVNGGAMDGFVKSAAATTGTDGHFVMSYYDQTDLPFYYWLASTWSFNDHHFASIRSGTYPDRLFMLMGTNDGVKQTALDYPSPTTPSIMDRLTDAGFSWGVYSDGDLLSGSLNWDHTHAGAYKMADFLDALDKGTLPNVSFVDGVENKEDEHPTADVQKGEAWTRNVYAHAVKSPQWPRMALIWTYDEGGGFADHVAPPNKACVARPDNPKDTPYYELGVRIPFAVISPYAKPHYVSHTVQEHTAITRFLEVLFDLPALTARDANSPALLDLFDFTTCPPPMLHPADAPAAGTGGCK